MIKKECFKKSAVHDYKNLGLIVVVIAALCGLIYVAHYIVTTCGEAIASGEAAILGFIGGVCTAYNLCCFFTIIFAILALKSTCESSKDNDQKYAESGGLYQDMILGLAAQIVITIVYLIVSWGSTLKWVCTDVYFSSCTFISNSSRSSWPDPIIPLISIGVLIIASPLAVAYARCKE